MLRNTLSVILILLGVLLGLTLSGLLNIPLAFIYTGIFIVAIVLLLITFYRSKVVKDNS